MNKSSLQCRYTLAAISAQCQLAWKVRGSSGMRICCGNDEYGESS